MTGLELIGVGESTAVVIPDDILARLNVKKGDVLHVVETADDELRLIPFDPALAAKMDNAEDIMRRYRNTLDALAK
jgi:putative addiction module antidote